jgi:hypothetical protein
MKAVFQYIKNLGVPRLRWVSLLSLALFLPTRVAHAQSWVDATVGWVLATIADFFFFLVAWITAQIGFVLDFSVQYFVLEMAELVNDIEAIDGLWQTFRDLGNIVFIGVLLYIAIRTILDVGNSFNTKRLLIRLVIVALFVNFSLFATKAIVDTSNIVALQFYNSIQVEGCDASNCNISHFFAGATNISSVQSSKSIENEAAVQGSKNVNFKIALARVLGTLFLLVAAFVMGAMALLLMIRFGVLVLLMIASPLAFIALILPSVDLGEQWLDKLLNQSFFAPALFAMLYVVAELASGLQKGIGGSEDNTDLMAAILSPDGGKQIGVILVFVLMIFLMASTLVVAKKMGAHGATKAVSLGKSARNWGQTKIVGGAKTVAYSPLKAAGAGARETVGRGFRKLDEKFAKSPRSKTAFGEAVRNKTTKKLSEEAQFGTGKSYRDVEKKRDKRESEKATLETRQDVQNKIDDLENQVQAGSISRAEVNTKKRRELSKLSSKEQIDFGKKFLKEHAEVLSENTIKAIDKHDDFQERDKQEIKDAAVDTLKSIQDPNRTTPAAGDIKNFLGTRSDDQLQNIDIDLISQPQVIQNMSADQFKTTTKNKSKVEKDAMTNTRLEPLKGAVISVEREYDPNAVKNEIDNMKNEEDVAKLLKLADDSIRTDDAVVDEISPKILSELAGSLKPGEKQALRDAIIGRATTPGRTTTDQNRRAAEWLEDGTSKALF